jgi:predicted permease
MRVRSLFRGGSTDAALKDELRVHLDEQIDEYVAAGATPADARARAMRELGSLALIEEECRDTRRVAIIHNFVRDLRYAIRALGRQPLLVTTAAASIAVAVAANCTIFSLASELLLSAPSVRRPEQVVRIRLNGNSHVSYGQWKALDESGALDGLAGYRIESEVNWRGPDESVSLIPMIVTANFFDVLGVPIAMGRGFTSAEADPARLPQLAVVSHAFWQHRLHGDINAVGSTLTFNGRPYTLLGVLPKTFRALPGYGVAPEVYLPVSRDLRPGMDRPRDATAELVGRLREGQSLQQAGAALSVAGDRVGPLFNDPRLGRNPRVFPVAGFGRMSEIDSLGPFFAVLLVGVGLVLAIACANVAGLLLARSTVRRREIAVRVALGASRARLIQQLMTEGLWLAALGTFAGLTLTFVLMNLIGRVDLPLPVPLELHAQLDMRLLLFSLALLIVTTVLCGLAPAIQATRPSLVPALKQEASQSTHRRWSLRACLVVGQVAIALVLLLSAILFLRNLGSAAGADPGFDLKRTVVAQFSFVEGRFTQETRAAFLGAAAERLRSLPAVDGAAFSHAVPLTIRSGMTTGVDLRVVEDARTFFARYEVNLVGPDYFAVMGIGLVKGREFTAADRSGTPRVVVINEEMARRHFADVDPVGRHLVLPGPEKTGYPAEIVGIVRNSRHRTIGEEQQAAIYEPYLQRGSGSRLVHVLVRTSGDPAAVARDVRQILGQMDPTAAIDVQPIRSALAFAFMPSRIGAALLGVLGALGLVLAMVGLYAVVAYGVSRRTSEIGIRMALGATRGAVLRLVMNDAAILAAAGIGIGLTIAAFVTQPLAMFLVAGLSARDPLTFAGTAIVLAVVSLAAAWTPARRALRIDPVVALRNE